MPVTAKTIFTQAPGGARPAGQAVADGAAGNVVTVTNESNTGIASWQLALTDRPTGPETDCTSVVPTGVFASGNTPLVSGTFTPDVPGNYLVQLDVEGTDGSTATYRSAFGVPNERGWHRPGFKQAVQSSQYHGQQRGWAYNTDRMERDARAAALKTNKLKQPHTIVSGMQQTDQTSFVVVGGRRFNPSDFVNASADISRLITVRIEMYATPGMTAQFRLFNYTDGVQVATSVLSTSSNTPVPLSATLAVPGDLPNANKLYEAQLRISAGTPTSTDRAILIFAAIDVSLEG